MPSGLLTAFPSAALFLSGALSARQTDVAAFSSVADALPSAAEAVSAAFVLRRESSPDSLLKNLCHCERRRLALAGGCLCLYSRVAEKGPSRKPVRPRRHNLRIDPGRSSRRGCACWTCRPTPT